MAFAFNVNVDLFGYGCLVMRLLKSLLFHSHLGNLLVVLVSVFSIWLLGILLRKIFRDDLDVR